MDLQDHVVKPDSRVCGRENLMGRQAKLGVFWDPKGSTGTRYRVAIH